MHVSTVDISKPTSNDGFLDKKATEKVALRIAGNRGLSLVSRMGTNSKLWRCVISGRVDDREARWIITDGVSAATITGHLAKLERIEKVAKDSMNMTNVWRSGPGHTVNVAALVEIFRDKFHELEVRNDTTDKCERFGKSSLRSMFRAIEWCEKDNGIGLSLITDQMQVPRALCMVAEAEFGKQESNKAPFLTNEDLISIEMLACGLVPCSTVCDQVFAFMLCVMSWCGHRFENVQSMGTTQLRLFLAGNEATLYQDKCGINKTVSLNPVCYIAHNWQAEEVTSLIPMHPQRDCLMPAVSKDYNKWLNSPLTCAGASTWLTRVWKLVGRQGCANRINSFRRSFTKDALTSGLTQVQVQRIMRWRTPEMVTYYTDSSGQDSTLRGALATTRKN